VDVVKDLLDLSIIQSSCRRRIAIVRGRGGSGRRSRGSERLQLGLVGRHSSLQDFGEIAAVSSVISPQQELLHRDQQVPVAL